MNSPLVSALNPVPAAPDMYRGITDFVNMSFDNNRDTSAVGPLEIAAVPELTQVLKAGTSTTVAPDTQFLIDLMGALRPDTASFSVTSSNGAITFRSDTEIRECKDAPGRYRIPGGTLVSIDDAEIQIPGEAKSIRFSGLTASCKEETFISLERANEASFEIAA